MKLAETENSVEGMKEELIALQPELVVAQKETAEMMVVVAGESEAAEKVKVVVEAEEAKASSKAAEVKEIKDDCEADLAEAIPVLNAALAALDTLKKLPLSAYFWSSCVIARASLPCNIFLSLVSTFRSHVSNVSGSSI